MNVLIKYYTLAVKNKSINVKQFCIDHEISRTVFYYWKKRYQLGLIGKHKQRGRKTVISNEMITFIDNILTKNSSLTIHKLFFKCKEYNYNISKSTIYKIIYSVLKYRFKRRHLVTLPNSYNKKHGVFKMSS